jgi:hypothetical protein
MTDIFIRGLMVHFLADWILQSDWMSENKVSLRHPAAWIHSSIHTLGLLLVFPSSVALLLGISHLLIDTRIPLIYLRKGMGQEPKGAQGTSFVIWQDQVVHILLIYIAAAYL